MKVLPLVLDTDIGDDIDDALALALILNSPELELSGITTVFRNAPRRAVLARHMLKAWNRDDIPVLGGCSKPLPQSFDSQLGSQFEILDKDAMDESTGHAIDFLISQSTVHSAEVPKNPLTILAIGPLTNIALAIAREPRLVSMMRLVMMGGMRNASAVDYKTEWNVACDPEAAAVVFESGMEISMIGLDVTSRCVLEEKHLAQIKAHDSLQTRLLIRMTKLWMRDAKRTPTLNDPLAVLTLFDHCVKFEAMKIEVVLNGEERGLTRVGQGTANTRVAVEVDVPRAIELFMQRVLFL